MDSKQQLPFFLFVTALYVLLLGWGMFTKGCFGDGIMYAATAQNLANGYGDIWYLNYTQHPKHMFWGHPPLAIWIQALFMKYIGEYFWGERLLSSLYLIFVLVGMSRIWKLIFPNKSKYSIWWGMLLLLTLPLLIWSYSNNMLENLLTLWGVWAVYYGLKTGLENKIQYALLAGIFVFLATMTKGPVGLYPLVVIAIYGVVFKTMAWSRIIYMSLGVLAGLVIPYCFLFLVSEDALIYFTNYYNRQLGPDSVTVTQGGNHFYILGVFALEFVFLWAIIFFTIGRYSYTKQKIDARVQKWFLVFFLIVLAAVLPIMISGKQMRFYIVPAMPMAALATAVISYTFVESILNRYITQLGKPLILVSGVVLLLAIGLSSLNYGTYNRDEALLQDIEKLKSIIPEKEAIVIKRKGGASWSIFCYMTRYGKWRSHDWRWKDESVSYLLKGKKWPRKIKKAYQKTDVELNTWILYKLKTKPE